MLGLPRPHGAGLRSIGTATPIMHGREEAAAAAEEQHQLPALALLPADKRTVQEEVDG